MSKQQVKQQNAGEVTEGDLSGLRIGAKRRPKNGANRAPLPAAV